MRLLRTRKQRLQAANPKPPVEFVIHSNRIGHHTTIEMNGEPLRGVNHIALEVGVNKATELTVRFIAPIVHVDGVALLDRTCFEDVNRRLTKVGAR